MTKTKLCSIHYVPICSPVLNLILVRAKVAYFTFSFLFLTFVYFFPQHLCWGSTFLLPLSVSRFIAGIKLFRPPRATRTPLLLLLLLLYLGCCTLLLLYLECIFWKAIFTTLKYLATHPNLLLLYLLLL